MSVPHDGQAVRLAQGLGWLSIALGISQLASPKTANRLVGVQPTRVNRDLMRLVGVRELVAGIGILSRRQPSGFLWARVGGDAMDLALLGNAVASQRDTHRDTRRTGAAAAAVAGVAALDVVAARRSVATGQAPEGNTMEARTAAITINAPSETVYASWRDFEGLPTFMYHLESVQPTGDGRSHWVAKAPGGTTIEWDAEVTDDIPGERIAWRSVEGASVRNEGSVRFADAPGGQGTEVSVELAYSPPGGAVGSLVAKLFGEEPGQQISDDLRRFKQLVETGEIARSEGSPWGSRAKNAAHQKDAHPREDGEIRAAIDEEQGVGP